MPFSGLQKVGKVPIGTQPRAVVIIQEDGPPMEGWLTGYKEHPPVLPQCVLMCLFAVKGGGAKLKWSTEV